MPVCESIGGLDCVLSVSHGHCSDECAGLRATRHSAVRVNYLLLSLDYLVSHRAYSHADDQALMPCALHPLDR